MLIIPSKPKNFYAPVQTTFTLRGVPLVLSVRPLDVEKEDELLGKAEKHQAMVHPETRQLVRVAYTDKDEFFALLVDHCVAEFSGVGESDAKPWPVDREHKVKLCAIVPLPGENQLWRQVRDRAYELAEDQYAKLAKERENQEKN